VSHAVLPNLVSNVASNTSITMSPNLSLKQGSMIRFENQSEPKHETIGALTLLDGHPLKVRKFGTKIIVVQTLTKMQIMKEYEEFKRIKKQKVDSKTSHYKEIKSQGNNAQNFNELNTNSHLVPPELQSESR
jgi:hypothetical protein